MKCINKYPEGIKPPDRLLLLVGTRFTLQGAEGAMGF
jgi:hypothetical protein